MNVSNRAIFLASRSQASLTGHPVTPNKPKNTARLGHPRHRPPRMSVR
jgi:hypothetical protein